MEQTTAGTLGASKEFVISREFDAPRDLVWKAVTEPERLKQWWGPKGFTVKAAEVDLRPGGTFRYGLTGPNGYEMWGLWVYEEIDPPARLATIVSFIDEAGNQIRHPLEPKWPLEVRSVLTLEERGGKTVLAVTSSAHNATDEEIATFEAGFESMEAGFTGTFDQLAAYLARA
jgi:uncharacterized protein YndB with AHSA1/START domain